MRLVPLLSLTLVAVSPGATGVTGATPLAPAAGVEAPAGCWTVAGGSAANSGAAATPAPRGPVETAWDFEPAGAPIEGEPLVWEDRVVLETADSTRRRSLHVLDLETGRPFCPAKHLPTALPLRPSLWRNLVAVRAAPDLIEAYQVSGRPGLARLGRVWQHRVAGPLAGHLLVGSKLYTAGDGGLARASVGAREADWVVPGRFRARPVLRGDGVWSLRYDERGRAILVEAEAGSGAVRLQLALGDHDGAVPTTEDGPEIASLGHDLFVAFPLPLGQTGSAGGGARHTVWMTPPASPAGAVDLRFRTLDLAGVPVAVADGSADWIARFADGERGPMLGLHETLPGRTTVLADGDLHPEFLADGARPSRAGDVVLLGARAVDPEDLRILWTADHATDRRVVPARGTALVVEDGRRLVALRTRAPRSSDAGARFAAARAALREVEREADEALASGYAKLARDTLGTGDAALVARLLDEAWAHGAGGRELDAVAQQLALLGAPRSGAGAEALLGRVLEREDALLAAHRDAVWRAVGLLPREAPFEQLATFLGAALERAPEDREVAEAVRALLPPGVEPDLAAGIKARGDRAAPEWLAFAIAAHQTSVQVEPPAAGATDRVLLGDGLRIESAVDRPGALAGCLSLGALVCDALEEIFAGGAARRLNHAPLVLRLYASREAYLAAGSGERGMHGGFLEHTAGYFDPSAGLSHVYVPPPLPGEDSGESFQRVRATLAHELTHHWLHVRCPRLADDDLARLSRERGGYWVVEGFASLVEEMSFDLEARTWDADNREASSLDVLAHAPADALLPWERVIAMTQDEAQALSPEPRIDVALGSWLGKRRPVSDLGLFYEQSAALAHALFRAEGGRHRQALLRYLLAFYGGNERDLDLRRVFGMDAAELGARTEAFAADVYGPGR